MYHVDDGSNILHGCMLQNAMPQVEDMTGTTLRTTQNILDTLFDLWQRRKEQCRIQIPLHAHVIAEPSHRRAGCASRGRSHRRRPASAAATESRCLSQNG